APGAARLRPGGIRRPPPARPADVDLDAGHAQVDPRTERATGRASERRRREARHDAQRRPEEAAGGDARGLRARRAPGIRARGTGRTSGRTRRTRRTGWASPWRPAERERRLPRLSVRPGLSRLGRQGAEARQDRRRAATEGTGEKQRFMSKTTRLFLLTAVLVLLAPSPAQAYIGPGAGFALAGSFFAVFAAVCSAVLTILTWPVRLLLRTLRGLRAGARSRFKRVV